jgi:hypothetical protein
MAVRAQIILVCFLFPATSVQADPITVTFTAFPAPGDPVNTGPSMGSFMFDSSLIPPDGGQIQDSTYGLGATSVNFQWGTTLFTRANADLGELQFSSSGQLLAWVLGGTESPTGRAGIYSYITGPPSAVIDDIFVRTFAGIGGGADITYTLAGIGGSWVGRLVTDSVPAPVPEPTSMLLVASGAALVARRMRRRTIN